MVMGNRLVVLSTKLVVRIDLLSGTSFVDDTTSLLSITRDDKPHTEWRLQAHELTAVCLHLQELSIRLLAQTLKMASLLPIIIDDKTTRTFVYFIGSCNCAYRRARLISYLIVKTIYKWQQSESASVVGEKNVAWTLACEGTDISKVSIVTSPVFCFSNFL